MIFKTRNHLTGPWTEREGLDDTKFSEYGRFRPFSMSSVRHEIIIFDWYQKFGGGKALSAEEGCSLPPPHLWFIPPYLLSDVLANGISGLLRLLGIVPGHFFPAPDNEQ